jgi:hypothetical protein
MNNITVTELKNHHLICKKKKSILGLSDPIRVFVYITVKHPFNAGLKTCIRDTFISETSDVNYMN